MNKINKKMLLDTFDKVYFSFEKVNFSDIHLLSEVQENYNGYNFFNKDDLFSYLIKPFKKNQPKTYEVLKESIFFYAIEKSWIPQNMPDITQFGILLNNFAYYIQYTPYPYSEKPDDYIFNFIPQFILNSWLLHSEAWDVAEESTTNIYKSRLPSLKMPIHSIISDFEDKKNIDVYSDFLTKKFNHKFRKNYEEDKYNDMDTYFQLLILLDTRNTDEFSEKSGFQLFVSTHNDKKEIYVTTHSDVFSIKKLSNAQDAIDSYGEHVFSGKEGEFDFSPYLVDF